MSSIFIFHIEKWINGHPICFYSQNQALLKYYPEGIETLN